jgi:hypothetical protein
MKRKLIAGILVVAVVAMAVGVVSARNNFSGPAQTSAGEQSFGQCWMNQLTEELRQELRQQIQEQRQELHQQMHEFRHQLCAQYNIGYQNCQGFVDENGDDICDHKGTYGHGYQRIWIQMASSNFNYGRIARTETGQTDADRATIMHERRECVEKHALFIF